MPDEDKLEWTTCCRRKGSCPKISTDDGHVLLKDDYGNRVRIRFDQVDDVVLYLNLFRDPQKTE